MMTQRVLLTLACLASLHLSVQGKTNIVVMMSDDMGYSDLGCYGSEIRTPHLDGLAEGGVRFTQFYNTARCCPTRAALLTGLYPHQAGVGWMMNDSGHAGYRGDLNRRSVTIAEALKPAGYRTYMAGKWHVTKHIKPEGPSHNWPRQRGFDRFYGTIHGAGSFFDPNTLMRGNTMISPFADPEYQPETFYYTDAISDHAVRFIREHERDHAEKPFFLYVSYTAAHWPMHALEKDIAKYKGQYDEGYAVIRQRRFEKMKALGVIAPDAELSPASGSWEDMPHKEWDIRNMEVYAAMVDNMDQGIGRIVGALKEAGEFENTLVLFFQDNGGCAEAYGRRPKKVDGEWPLRADRPTLEPLAADYLQPRMQPVQTRDGWPVLTGPGVMPGPADTYIGYGREWANVSNTPFREYKHWTHEGGISSPFIAHWPAGLERRGEIEPQAGHLIDIMATCIDVSGATYPKKHVGQRIQPMEGVSLVPALRGEDLNREAPLFWEHEGNRAIRMGPWKLVSKQNAGNAWELYHMDRDRSELHNLAEAEPARVEAMAAQWHMWALRANVFPLTPYYKNRNR